MENENKPELLTIELAPDVRMEFVTVPAGKFIMGSDKNKDEDAREDELPQHTVTLAAFWIGKYPVTNLQYQVFVQAKGVNAPKDWQDGQFPDGKEDHPVSNVSWEEAEAFCQWATGLLQAGPSASLAKDVRMPTEAEWEKAARGTDGRLYPWGNRHPDDTLCNFTEIIKDTTPVGKYSPQGDSPYGCVDIAGNVWEWTADYHSADYYQKSPKNNPHGPDTGMSRVVRGGAMNSLDILVRCAARSRFRHTLRYRNIGFRCAASCVIRRPQKA
jgi:formylglycine-generating enzyme required for sulfatase activity